MTAKPNMPMTMTATIPNASMYYFPFFIVLPYALLSSVEYAFQGAVYACGNSIAVS